MPGTLVRRAVKAAVLPVGLLGRRRRGDLSVLLYHRVGEGPGEIELPSALFERQMVLLAERRLVRPLDDALADPAPGGVVVTFDDGFADFPERVLPVLVQHRVPAALYLTTGLVAGEGGSPNGHRPLTWQQLREAVATGLVTVGAHTHTHANLARATEEECELEMRRSKELIEDRLGVACRHFAYPFAVASPAAERVARRLFRSAALDAWRTNRRGSLDPHRLGRTPILRSDGWAFFRAKVAGLLDHEAFAYRMLGRGPWGAR